MDPLNAMVGASLLLWIAGLLIERDHLERRLRVAHQAMRAIDSKPKPRNPGMLPHQQRVIDERDQLAERLDKLRAFIKHEPGDGTLSIFNSLDQAERDDLRAQAHHMGEYKAILNRRIYRFAPQPEGK